VLPPPCPIDVQPTDFSRASELIARARTDTGRFLERQDPVCVGDGALLTDGLDRVASA
jgi:hypothetical protein